MLILNLALAIGPGLILLYWAYRRDSARPEPSRLLFRAFALGFVAVVIAVAAGFVLIPIERYLSGVLRTAFSAFVVAGLMEEVSKYAVILFFVARHQEFDEVADGIVYAMAASLGFAVLENALFIGGSMSTLLLRGLTAVPVHGALGGIMGYFIGMDRIAGKKNSTTGLLIAVVLHGTYDFLLFTGGLASLLAIPLILGMVVSLRRLFTAAVNDDRAAGRIGPVV